jgi:ABC-type transport system involved in cytochrome c biogenesis permease component
VIVAVLVVPLYVPVIVTVVDALTAVVEMLKEAPEFPLSTVTVAGTLATPGLLLESDTAAPD